MFECLCTDMYNLLGYLCICHFLLTFKIQQNHADICLDAYQILCKIQLSYLTPCALF